MDLNRNVRQSASRCDPAQGVIIMSHSLSVSCNKLGRQTQTIGHKCCLYPAVSFASFSFSKIFPAQKLASCLVLDCNLLITDRNGSKTVGLGCKVMLTLQLICSSILRSHFYNFSKSLWSVMCMMFEPLAEGNLLSHYMVDDKVSWILCATNSATLFSLSLLACLNIPI